METFSTISRFVRQLQVVVKVVTEPSRLAWPRNSRAYATESHRVAVMLFATQGNESHHSSEVCTVCCKRGSEALCARTCIDAIRPWNRNRQVTLGYLLPLCGSRLQHVWKIALHGKPVAALSFRCWASCGGEALSQHWFLIYLISQPPEILWFSSSLPRFRNSSTFY